MELGNILNIFETVYCKYINTGNKVIDLENIAPSGGGGSNYVQSTRLGSKAGQSFDLSINSTVDFNKPPAEILKFKQGSTEVQTKNTFDSSEASDFVINRQEAVNNEFDYVSLDGTIHPKVKYDIVMSTPVVITDGTTTGYISESDEIDFGDWDDVLGVVIR